jgi:curli biogenesis system outer membrane secretion channel CsgG
MKGFAALLALLVALGSGSVKAQQSPLSIGVAQVDDQAQTGSSDGFARMMESALASTGRFRVVEREQLARLMSPPAPARSRRGRARSASAPTKPPVDYLIEATIVSAGTRARTNIGTSLLGGVLSGLGVRGGETHCSNHEASIAIDIRVLQAASREVRHTLRVNETQRAAAACGEQSEIDMPRLLRAAANRAAGDLVTSIYPIQIAAVEPDGTVLLNYGTGTVQPEAAYSVYATGQPIRDPATGQVIGNQETRLGYVRVSEVSPRMSRATPIGSLAPQVGAILRPASRDEVRKAERAAGRQRSGRR